MLSVVIPKIGRSAVFGGCGGRVVGGNGNWTFKDDYLPGNDLLDTLSIFCDLRRMQSMLGVASSRLISVGSLARMDMDAHASLLRHLTLGGVASSGRQSITGSTTY